MYSLVLLIWSNRNSLSCPIPHGHICIIITWLSFHYNCRGHRGARYTPIGTCFGSVLLSLCSVPVFGMQHNLDLHGIDERSRLIVCQMLLDLELFQFIIAFVTVLLCWDVQATVEGGVCQNIGHPCQTKSTCFVGALSHFHDRIRGGSESSKAKRWGVGV